MEPKRLGKYACVETEKRYLLRRPPEALSNESVWDIVDRYWPGTRLRLRSMYSPQGDEWIYKLTQKYHAADQAAAETTITNLYLTEAEYVRLKPLEALVIVKRRHRYVRRGETYSIDVFQRRHAGLILAEREFGDLADAEQSRTPDFAALDVTDDAFFQGMSLAEMSDEDFKEGLATRLRAA